MTVLPSRFRTAKVVLLIVLTAILATVILVACSTASKADASAAFICAAMADGESTWNSQVVDPLIVQSVIKQCPEVAFSE